MVKKEENDVKENEMPDRFSWEDEGELVIKLPDKKDGKDSDKKE